MNSSDKTFLGFMGMIAVVAALTVIGITTLKITREVQTTKRHEITTTKLDWCILNYHPVQEDIDNAISSD